MDTLGIDLGTTNTVVAVDDQVIHLDAGRCMPSVVAYLPNGRVETGESARGRRSIDSQNTIYSSKRIIGRAWDDVETQEFRDRYPFEMTEVEGRPAFVTRAGTFEPSDIAAVLLSKIFDDLKRVVSGLDLVITVPAAFGRSQREATLEAARKANFRDTRLIEEPLAAVRAYLAQDNDFQKVAVYDLGGGTFDFAVLDCGGETPKLLGTSSDLFLGGDDIDHQISRWVANEILKRHNWDLTNYPEVYDRLLAQCEQAKIRLSSSEQTLVDLAQVDPEFPAASGGISLRRSVMDELSEPLVRRSFITCDQVLRDVGLVPADLDAILLAGGTTHLPMIQHGVEAYFGKPGHIHIEPREVVARGASLSDGGSTGKLFR